jgi:hypothetical protein
MRAAADAFVGKTAISGRLPVLVNDKLKAGSGIDLRSTPKSSAKVHAAKK